MYNRTVKLFLERNNINPDEISKQVDCEIKTIEDIDYIISNYIIEKEKKDIYVSVADIVGFYWLGSSDKRNIFDSLNDYFDLDGDGYHARSCDNLENSADKMLKSNSFNYEPICLLNINPEKNIYVVTTNGKHRFISLKCLYLSELAKNKDNEKELRKKYTFFANSRDLDVIKTYSNFIIRKLLGSSLRIEFDQNYKMTGNSILSINNEQKVFNDEELLTYVRQLILSNLDFVNIYINNEGFKKFVENNLKINLGDLEEKYEL